MRCLRKVVQGVSDELDFSEIDITDVEAVDFIFRNHTIWVIHFAGIEAVGESVKTAELLL